MLSSVDVALAEVFEPTDMLKQWEEVVNAACFLLEDNLNLRGKPIAISSYELDGSVTTIMCSGEETDLRAYFSRCRLAWEIKHVERMALEQALFLA